MNNPKIGKIISISTAAVTVLLGVLLIIFTAHLFFTGGDNPYSRERVGEYLVGLIVPAVIFILLVTFGIVHNVITKNVCDDGAKRSESEMIEGYAKRFDLDALNEKVRGVILRERDLRQKISVICNIVSAIFCVLSLVYVTFIANYTVENLNGDVVSALAVALTLATVALLSEMVRTILCEKSAGRERGNLLFAVKEGYKPAPPTAESVSDSEKKTINIVRYVVLGVSVILIILGIINGGMADVLAKAVKICTECIGLG